MPDSISDMSTSSENNRFSITRRAFLRISAISAVAVAASRLIKYPKPSIATPADESTEGVVTEKWVPTSCLNCPFPQCIYEQPGGRQHWLKTMRDREIVRQFTKEGKEIKELALLFGVSTRTVQRALGKTLVKGERSENE